MRDPYLFDDINVLKNRANIRDNALLHTAEADITNLAMTAIYERQYEKFNVETLNDIKEAACFIEDLPEYSEELFVNKKMKTSTEVFIFYLFVSLLYIISSGR